jgi:hypothetical protein
MQTGSKMRLPFSNIITSSKDVSGSDFRDAALRQVEAWHWPPSQAAEIIGAMADAPLSQQQAVTLASKGIGFLSSVASDDEIPALGHQLLKFASKSSTQGIVMLGICENIGQRQSSTSIREGSLAQRTEPDKLTSMKGNVLFHIEFALKQDVKLCTSFIREAKCEPEPVITDTLCQTYF